MELHELNSLSRRKTAPTQGNPEVALLRSQNEALKNELVAATDTTEVEELKAMVELLQEELDTLVEAKEAHKEAHKATKTATPKAKPAKKGKS
jgi:hypothetical protein